MRWLVLGLILFTTGALLAWPYIYLYRLDRAVGAGDLQALAELTDLDAIRASARARLAARISGKIGRAPGWVQEGVNRIGRRAVDLSIDLEWVQRTLRDRGAGTGRLIGDVGYAFFESPRSFLTEIERTDDEPLRVWMALKRNRWVVTRIDD